MRHILNFLRDFNDRIAFNTVAKPTEQDKSESLTKEQILRMSPQNLERAIKKGYEAPKRR